MIERFCRFCPDFFENAAEHRTENVGNPPYHAVESPKKRSVPKPAQFFLEPLKNSGQSKSPMKKLKFIYLFFNLILDSFGPHEKNVNSVRKPEGSLMRKRYTFAMCFTTIVYKNSVALRLSSSRRLFSNRFYVKKELVFGNLFAGF